MPSLNLHVRHAGEVMRRPSRSRFCYTAWLLTSGRRSDQRYQSFVSVSPACVDEAAKSGYLNDTDSHPRHNMRSISLLLAISLAACSSSPRSSLARINPSTQGGEVGVLVMAHGGSDEWNQTVEAATSSLAQVAPTVVAFGMANPYSLRLGLRSLRSQGVSRVAVVRLFLSGESFLAQTEYLLGLSPTPPGSFVLMGPAAADPTAREPLDHQMAVATHPDGLMTSAEARRIISDRARELSVHPESESVLVIAHGMGDEAANDRVLEAMESAGERIRSRGFADVRVATLREDWAEHRVVAEIELRDYVTAETSSGRKVIVVPMRLAGFGPYAEVLAGLDYLPADGLLPHDQVNLWLQNTAARVACSAGWGPALGPCPVADPVDRTP